MDSYLSVKAGVGVVAQELLQAVADGMDVPQGDLGLVAATYPGGKRKTATAFHQSVTRDESQSVFAG